MPSSIAMCCRFRVQHIDSTILFMIFAGLFMIFAGVAQLEAQAICNRQVVGSSPTTSSAIKQIQIQIQSYTNQ